MEETKNLMSGLLDEMNRKRELLKMYEKIPQGVFGAIFIRQAIKQAENAMISGDIVGMLKAFQALKEIE